MICEQCGLENPKQSKFCRKCGASLKGLLRCAQCGCENPQDSIFCTECGKRLTGNQKSVKGTRRKCRNCGHFNELDALFCVRCGTEIMKVPKDDTKRQSAGPSYKTIALVIGIVFLFGFVIKLGINFSKQAGTSKRPVASPLSTTSPTSTVKVDEAKVVAVAKNFKCACGGCGELPLEECTCDMPKGALEEKNFIREKLGEGLTVKEIIELVDKKYGHRV